MRSSGSASSPITTAAAIFGFNHGKGYSAHACALLAAAAVVMGDDVEPLDLMTTWASRYGDPVPSVSTTSTGGAS